jgi:hypothetical protein
MRGPRNGKRRRSYRDGADGCDGEKRVPRSASFHVASYEVNTHVAFAWIKTRRKFLTGRRAAIHDPSEPFLI